jgi:hypothetical protein
LRHATSLLTQNRIREMVERQDDHNGAELALLSADAFFMEAAPLAGNYIEGGP